MLRAIKRASQLFQGQIRLKNMVQKAIAFAKPPEGFEKFARRKNKRKTDEEPGKEDPEKGQETPQEAQKPETKEKEHGESKPTHEGQKADEKSHQEGEKRQTIEREKEKEKEKEEEHIEQEPHEKKPKTARHSKRPRTFFDLNDQFQGDKHKKSGSGSGGTGGGPYETPPSNQNFGYMRILFLAGMVFFLAEPVIDAITERNMISYTQFVKQYLEKGQITKITITRYVDNTVYKTFAIIETKDQGKKKLSIGNADAFLEQLEKYQLETLRVPAEELIPVEFLFKTHYNKWFDRAISAAFFMAMIGLMFVMYRGFRNIMNSMRGGGGNDPSSGVGKANVRVFDMEGKVKTRFKDVAGLDEAKNEIVEFVDFLKRPKKYLDLGAKIPRGALLTGPPGTGKTMLAKAAAGEAGVPFFYISGSDFVEMYVGVGAARVRDLFKKAKAKAPSIIFIDEIDAVGKKREVKASSNDERDNTLNQLLVEMDGFETKEQVVVMAATNRKDILDNALTRPGRFDRIIEVDLPDMNGRKAIFMVHLKPLKIDPAQSMEELAQRLASLTPGFSGADIHNVCNEAAIIAARHNHDFVTLADCNQAAERVIAGLEKKKVLSHEEKELMAINEAGRAIASWFLPGGMVILKLTIIPHSKSGMGYTQFVPDETALHTKEELLDRLCCILGGRCAEEILLGKISTTATEALKKVNELANSLVTKYGMSDRLGWVTFHENEQTGAKRHAKGTDAEIDREVRRIVAEAQTRTTELIKEKKELLRTLTDELLKKETLDLPELEKILGPRPYPPKSNYKAYLEIKKKIEQGEAAPAPAPEQKAPEPNA